MANADSADDSLNSQNTGAALSAKRLRCLRSTPLTGCGRPAFSSSLAIVRNRYSGIPTFTWKKRLVVFVGPQEFVSSALPSTV